MKYKGEYESRVNKFFNEDKNYIMAAATIVKNKHYSIPLEIDDLISFAHFKLLEPENKIEYFGLNSDEENVSGFFRRKLYAYMWTYCNIYKSKNHQILNNNICFEYVDNLENISCSNYNYEELFWFLTYDEFIVIYEMFVNKLSIKKLTRKMNLSFIEIRLLEIKAKSKIYKYLNIIL